MARLDKLAIALQAIESIPPKIRAQGAYRGATALQPASWYVDYGAWKINLTENVLLCPDDSALSMLLDIWAAAGGKVLSVSWMPDQPWRPPRVVQCKPGAWQDLLDDEDNLSLS